GVRSKARKGQAQEHGNDSIPLLVVEASQLGYTWTREFEHPFYQQEFSRSASRVSSQLLERHFAILIVSIGPSDLYPKMIIAADANAANILTDAFGLVSHPIEITPRVFVE